MAGSDIPLQPTISAYFQPTTSTPVRKTGKRVSSPIDLTADDGELKSHPKRPRLVTPTDPSSSTSGARGDLHGSAEKRTSKQNRISATVNGTESDGKRLEDFKRSLIQDNNRFLKKGRNEKQGMAQKESGPSESQEEESDSFKKLTEAFSCPQKRKRGTKSIAATLTQSKRKQGAVLGPAGEPYTPLERQILQLKEENVGTVLMVEVGYKYKFFGSDAQVAAKELGMVAFQDRNFLVASIPTHRRDVHIKKLLAAGYRVGVVEQVETAALKKVSDNRNAPFHRKLTKLYTAATFVDGLDSVDELDDRHPSVFMCLIEDDAAKVSGSDICIGMISVCPSTGDVMWDDFKDTVMRLELETRLVHTRPSELLVSQHNVSPETRKMLSHFSGPTASNYRTHVETISSVMAYEDAITMVTEFYNNKKGPCEASANFKLGKLMAAIIGLPKRVIIALAHAIKYLSAFGLEGAFAESDLFMRFATKAHMNLAANTLINLEIFQNEDNSEKGTLIWVLDRTKTKFGSRLLRNWVGRPLVDKRLLQERIDTVEEILQSSSEILLTLRGLLKGLPDLARGLSRIQYGQCTMKELAIMLSSFRKIADSFDAVNSTTSTGPFKSQILNGIISSLPQLKEPMNNILKDINIRKLEQGDKTSLWNDWDMYPDIEDAKMSLQVIDMELDEELKIARKKLRMPSLQWATVAIDEYLVEVKRSENRPIPDDWILHSKTKSLARYRPPSVEAKLQERAQRRETLEHEANTAYRQFLKDLSAKYYSVLRDCVAKLATADCLLSLAQVALQKDYTRPEFTDDDRLEIVDGRHPMIEAFSDDPYISNTVRMGPGDAHTKIITGPNMGGKSSCVRMIALIALMAQVGSYVPASAVKTGLLDSILTRMGASDDLARGRSTFMVEMSETSEILKTATSRSLVILDELGRGTSTFDGMAIADATLQHLATTIKSKTLFITHYPLLASKLQSKFPEYIQNLHMGYDAESRIDGSRRITFLYKLIPGLATESFGIECARMAKIPSDIISVAAERARSMQEIVRERALKNKLRKTPLLIQQFLENSGMVAKVVANDLQIIKELLRDAY